MTFDGSTDRLTVLGGLWSEANNRFEDGDRLEYFDFADGSRLTLGAVEAGLLIGSTANETITGFKANDTLDGKGGTDFLSGRDGNDTYLCGLGYGQDTIDEENASGIAGSADRVLFGAGITQSNIHFARSNTGNWTDLIITFDGSSDRLVIRDTLWASTRNYAQDGDRVEYLDFADGSRLSFSAVELMLLTGTAANEAIVGYLSNDTIDGKGGTDRLNGLAGDDTYVFGRGYGTDTVDDEGATRRRRTACFSSGVAVGDVTFSRSGNSLIASSRHDRPVDHRSGLS